MKFEDARYFWNKLMADCPEFKGAVKTLTGAEYIDSKISEVDANKINQQCVKAQQALTEFVKALGDWPK